MPIKLRLMLWFTLLLTGVVACLIPVVLDGVSDTVTRAEDRELRGYLAAVEASIGQRANTAQALAELVSAMPATEAAVRGEDRAVLQAMFGPAFARLAHDDGLQQFQFHLPPGRSLIRLHQPDLFGDDLTGFRAMVVEANRRDQVVKGLESGVAGLGVRAVAPIAGPDRVAGSVEFGMDFGQGFADQFKARFGADIALYRSSPQGFAPIAATCRQSLANDAVKRAALDGGPILLRGERQGHPVASLLAPVRDYSGQPAALAEITIDAGDYQREYGRARDRTLMVAAAVLIAGLAIAWGMARSLSGPMVAMTEAMHRLAEGDAGVTVPAAERRDEIGEMAKAMFVFKRNRAEIERRRAERDQFARLGLLGEMASNIAHELNQPLASIQNYGQGMLRMLADPEADPGRLREGAAAVAQQAERAAGILQRIRSFVRRHPPHRSRQEVNALVRDAIGQWMETAAVPPELRPGEALAEGLPAVSADPGQIQQVLFNLLQNAREAGSREIRVATARRGPFVEIAVSDHGAGADQDTLDSLFRPFFTTKPTGLGLGLSICRTIVESHGGRIEAGPNAGGGLVMTVTLPAVDGEADNA